MLPPRFGVVRLTPRLRADLEKACAPLRPFFEARARAFDELAARLRDAGWQIDRCGGQVPVQLEGKLPDGRPFYLRCRYEACELRVGEVGDDLDAAITQPARVAERDDPTWEPFEAGWLGASDVESVLRSLLSALRLSGDARGRDARRRRLLRELAKLNPGAEKDLAEERLEAE